MEVLGTVWFCLLAAFGFGFVIFIHELGHFLFAKWAGVRVDRFSIGFGPVILRRQIGETEYAISLLPLGGYVKMLGQEDVPAEIGAEAKTDPRSYLAKHWGWQTAILLGGVLFNLISSYLILICIAWYGKPIVEPVVGSVTSEIRDEQGHPRPSPAAQIGLKAGDRILTLNGQPIREYENVVMGIISSGRDPLIMTVERLDAAGKPTELRLPADGPGVSAVPDFDNGRLVFGMDQVQGLTIAHAQAAHGVLPADAPKVSERISAVAGTPVPVGTTGQRLRDLLSPYAGTTVQLGLTSSVGERTVTLAYAGDQLDPSLAGGFPVRIDGMIDGGDANGFRQGDIVLSVDGQPVAGVLRFMGLTRAKLNGGGEFPVRVWRDGQELDLTVHGRELGGRVLLGVSPNLVTGYLPVLPPAFDGQPSPLTKAGVVPGDALIDLAAASDDLGKPREAAVVSGGQRVLIPLDKDDGIKARREVPAGLFIRVFGGATPNLATALRGKRVTAVEGGVLRLSNRDGIASSQPPPGISEAGWSAITAGLKAGDWITGVVPIGDAFALEAVRGAGAPKSVTIQPRDPGVAMVLEPVSMTTYHLKSWTEAFTIANDAAYTMVVKTLQIIPKFFKSTKDGGLDPNKALTGPVGIFTMLKGSAERFGFVKYLELMALIGLNLFLVNLLPIPVTDGGQLMFLAIETVTGRPLAPWARNVAMYIGLVMVLGLMIYVIGLDLLRIAGLN